MHTLAPTFSPITVVLTRVAGLSLVFGLAACGGPDAADEETGSSTNETKYADEDAASEIPDGVIDDDVAGEDSDADGYCFGPERGYFPCDDGAPPGSGPPGSGDGEDDDGPGAGGGDGDVNDPGGDGDDENDGPGGSCGAHTFGGEEATIPPRILLVVDKSGSMEDDAVGYSGSKWQGAREAISAVVSSQGDDVEFGLMLYPDGDAYNDVCNEGSVEVSVGANRADDIIDTLDWTWPGGGTPTASTLVEAKDALTGLGSEGGNRVAILFTDGGPNCNANLNPNTCECTLPGQCEDARNCLDRSGTIASAEALNDAGFAVFVVGIPGSENFTDVLNDLAVAGGTALSGSTKYYEADDQNALAQSLEAITNRVATCRFDLPYAPDPDSISVRRGMSYIPRDSSRTFGWDLVDADTVELFGASCDNAVAAQAEIIIDACPAVGG